MQVDDYNDIYVNGRKVNDRRVGWTSLQHYKVYNPHIIAVFVVNTVSITANINFKLPIKNAVVSGLYNLNLLKKEYSTFR